MKIPLAGSIDRFVRGCKSNFRKTFTNVYSSEYCRIIYFQGPNGMVDMDIKSKRTEFFNGARDTLPLVIGAIPFGIIFGTLPGGAGTTGTSINL